MSSADLHNPNSQAYKKARRLYFKATKNRNPDLELDWSPFRAEEKKYKARFPPPDLSNVLDLATLDPAREDEIGQGVWRGSHLLHYKELSAAGRSTKFYAIPEIPGAVVSALFYEPKQRELVRWSLCDQARENETNLDIHYTLPKDGLWNTWLRSRHDSSKDITVHPKATEASSVTQETPGPRQLVNNIPAAPDTFSTISNTPKPPPTPSASIKPSSASELLTKLRWANIGWFYHWGTKQYDFTKGKGVIDPRLRDLCRDAVAAVDWRQVYGETNGIWGDGEADWTTWNETYGVPRILDDTLPPHLKDLDENWEPYAAYMRTARINVNVRQVFPKGFKPDFVDA
ncbi:hypothetical protein H0H87_000069 [Tephrocybe sp. NHM501043]|nr:hypothetical protein H0H87_000069 [Tephrocybe sp. NHM501043]